MAIVEVDTLQRIRDMSFVDNGIEQGFRVARIATVEVDGTAYLIMTGEFSGIAVAEIEPRGGLSFIDATGTSLLNSIDGVRVGTGSATNASVVAYDFGDTTLLFTGSVNQYMGQDSRIVNDRVITSFELNPGGELDLLEMESVDYIPHGGGSVSSFGRDPVVTNVGGRDILIAPDDRTNAEAVFNTYEVKSDGSISFLKTNLTYTWDNDNFEAVKVGGKTFAVAMGQFDVAPLQVLRVFKSGEMRQVFELSPSDNAIFNRITTDIETVQIGNRSFVVVSEVTRGSILVYEINAFGRLELVEHEEPGRDDRWSSAESLVSFEQDGRTYVAGGGYGSGIGVFEMSRSGALTEVDEFQFTDSTIRYVYDLETRELGDGRQYIFASTATFDEVRSFRFIGEEVAITGGKRNLNGTVEDDQIFGRGGNDTLRGRDGDDMIEGGIGNDKIFGGEGNDNLYGNRGRDSIVGNDGYDFIFGQDARDILKGALGNDVIYGGRQDDRIFGGQGNDRLDGDQGKDIVRGNAGNDTLTDGFGEDTLIGGDGFDVFVISKDKTRDVIADYDDNVDKIDLTEFGRGLEFSDLDIRQNGDRVVIRVEGDRIVVTPDAGDLFVFDFSLGDFLFA